MNKTTYLCLLVCFVLLLPIIPLQATNSNIDSYRNDIQRVRLDFTMPNGYVRHLLLGFTPDNAATDGVDYGYDALNMDNYPDDLNWIIDNDRYIIQGVGAFNENNQYELGMFLENYGNIEISLASLENFESNITVFVYDSLLDTYTSLNDISFSGNFSPGEYLDRFFITFTNPTNNNNEISSNNAILSVDDVKNTVATVHYYRNSNEIHVSTNHTIKQIEVYNLLGKKILSKSNIHSKEFKLKIQNQINSPYGLVRIHTLSGTTVTKKIIL